MADDGQVRQAYFCLEHMNCFAEEPPDPMNYKAAEPPIHIMHVFGGHGTMPISGTRDSIYSVYRCKCTCSYLIREQELFVYSFTLIDGDE
uniref:SVR1 n=1 Tax=Arundo donax TaxID=35708 RepID=A0A0A9DXK5_ARUDO